MSFDLVIKNDNLTVYCSNELSEFANNFINYYNDHIEIIKDKLGIERNIKLIVALTNKEEETNFVYGKSDFSGFLMIQEHLHILIWVVKKVLTTCIKD